MLNIHIVSIFSVLKVLSWLFLISFNSFSPKLWLFLFWGFLLFLHICWLLFILLLLLLIKRLSPSLITTCLLRLRLCWKALFLMEVFWHLNSNFSCLNHCFDLFFYKNAITILIMYLSRFFRFFLQFLILFKHIYNI